VRGEEGNLLVYSEMANTIRKNTDASARDGVARSSDEALALRVERRGGVSLLTSVANSRCEDE
jgi:hypothetical protein